MFAFLERNVGLVFLLIPEEVILRGIVGPYVLYGLVDFTLIFEFLKVLDDFKRATRTLGIVQQFFLGGGPGGVLQIGGKFKCPVHFDSRDPQPP